MNWFEKIREWYKSSVWTDEMVQNAVKMGKITEGQVVDILSESLPNT